MAKKNVRLAAMTPEPTRNKKEEQRHARTAVKRAEGVGDKDPEPNFRSKVDKSKRK